MNHDKATVRDTIIDVSRELMARYGYRKMTVDDIAKEARIGKGTIYLHFHSKEDIAVASVDKINERLQERLIEMAANVDNPSAKLKKMVVERVLFRMDALKDHRQCLDEDLALLRPRISLRKESYYQAEAEIFAKVITEGQDNGNFRQGDALNIAKALILATNGFMPFSLTVKEVGEPEEVKRKLLSVFDLILQGLAFG